jgi:hypothetical protein
MRLFLSRMTISWILLFSVTMAAKAQKKSDATTLSSISSQQKVIAVVPWTVSDGDLVCIFTQIKITSQGQSGPARRMTIYRQNNTLLTKVFEEGSGDSFMNAFPLGESSDRLLVGWVSGSAHHFAAYAYLDGTVKKVLETGSKGMPEIIYDQNMQESILVSSLDLRDGQWRPISTDIYRWNGKSYDKIIQSVPWAQRFQRF